MRLMIRESIVAGLEKLEDYSGLDRKTIIGLAIYDGVKSIKNWYFPKIIKETEKVKRFPIRIDISEEMENKIDSAIEILNSNGIKTSKTLLIETLIRIELKKLTKLYFNEKEQEKIQDNDNVLLDEIKCRIQIPVSMKEDIIKMKENLGLKKMNQLQQYIFISGYCDIQRNISPMFLEADTELIDFINKLNVDLMKGICIADYVLRMKNR